MAGKDERDEQEFSLEDILAEFATNHVPVKPAEGPVSEGQGGEEEKAPQEPEQSASPSEPEKPQEPEKPEEGGEKAPAQAEKGPEKHTEVKERLVKRGAKPTKAAAPKEGWEENTIPFPIQPKEQTWKEDTIPFPVRPTPTDKPSAAGKKPGVVTAFPGARREEPKKEPHKKEPEKTSEAVPAQDEDPDATKVLEFPPQEPEGPSPLAQWLNKLRRKTDEFAGHMYEEEGVEDDDIC